MNSSSNPLHEQSLVEFKRIVEGYLVSGMCICGLLGNIFTCVILLNRCMRKSITNIYIFALSCASSCVLLGFLLTYGIRYTFHLETFYKKIFTPIYPMHITCLLIQIYLTAAVAVDRFILICLPFRIQNWRSPKRAIFIIVCICLFSIFYCLPFWFEYKLIKRHNATVITLSTFGSNRLFRLIMRKYLYFIFVFLLPLTIISVCKILIIKNLYLAQKRKRSLGILMKSNRSSNSINFLLLSIVFIFLLTQLPYFVFNVLYSWRGTILMKNLLARQYLTINNLLSVINASSTFILYAVFDRKFREVGQYIIFCEPLPSNFDSRNFTQHALTQNSKLSERRLMNSKHPFPSHVAGNDLDLNKQQKNVINLESMCT